VDQCKINGFMFFGHVAGLSVYVLDFHGHHTVLDTKHPIKSKMFSVRMHATKYTTVWVNFLRFNNKNQRFQVTEQIKIKTRLGWQEVSDLHVGTLCGSQILLPLL